MQDVPERTASMTTPTIRTDRELEEPPVPTRGAGLPWYALHTRARHEKKVQQRLRLGRFEVYLPTVPRERRWHDRQKVLESVMFRGYVFARFSVDRMSRVLATPGVANVVRHGSRPSPIRPEEIENVRRFAAAVSELGSVPEPEAVVERGQPVRIVSGPLAGVEGVVAERRGSGRALVQIGVRAIGVGMKVELETRRLRPIEDAGIARA
jgi:transcription antitermination factor NusG